MSRLGNLVVRVCDFQCTQHLSTLKVTNPHYEIQSLDMRSNIALLTFAYLIHTTLSPRFDDPIATIVFKEMLE